MFFSILTLTHYQTTNFRLFQAERVSRCNFEFDGNGRKLSKWVEYTVGKGEIARCEQSLLFPQCFQKACFPRASKGVTVWEWVKYKSLLLLYRVKQQIFGLILNENICRPQNKCSLKTEILSENIAGKEEKMLNSSMFSFSHNVFKRLLQGNKISGLCGKELN